MTSTFVPVVPVVDFCPGALRKALFCQQVDGVAQVLVTGPPLVAGPAGRVAPGFAGAAGHRGRSGQALQGLGLIAEAIPVESRSRKAAEGPAWGRRPVKNQTGRDRDDA